MTSQPTSERPSSSPVGPRVVSLLPSATETLFAIGGDHLLVGRSHECDYPPALNHLPTLTAARTVHTADPAAIDAQVREAARVGTTSLYTLDADALASLRPDVILTQDLCNVCSIDLQTVRSLAARLTPVPQIVSLNPTTLEAVLDDLFKVAEPLGLDDQALEAATRLRERMYAAADFANPYSAGISTALLEWTDPLYVGGHWNPQIVERAGGAHPLNPTLPIAGSGGALGPIGQTQRTAGKSRTISPAALVASQPQALIIAPCGRSLDQAVSDTQRLRQRGRSEGWWDSLPAVKLGKVAVVDGNQHFNRPGPRLVDAFEWMVGFLNDRPEIMPSGFPWVRL